MYDLPSEDPKEPGLPDEFHYYQPQLLRETFQPPQYAPEHFFVGTDLNLYYYVRRPMWHKRPDWFAVLGVSRLYDEHDLRMSYVIWQEGTAPYLIVELLSPGTEQDDLGYWRRMIIVDLRLRLDIDRIIRSAVGGGNTLNRDHARVRTERDRSEINSVAANSLRGRDIRRADIGCQV